MHIYRSINEPIRYGLTVDELWSNSDNGLVSCWEAGREKRKNEPQLAKQAESGELIPLVWAGGVSKKLKGVDEKMGSLYYLAMWLGLCGKDLDLDYEQEYTKICTKTKQRITFTKNYKPEN